MFPRLREQIGTALDLLVEFSTLGEYRLAIEGVGVAGAPADAPGQAPQLGGASALPPRAAVRRTVAGGAAGNTPVATPAARRLPGKAAEAAAKPARATKPARAPRVSRPAPATCRVERRRDQPKRAPSGHRARSGAPKAPEQLCLAV